MPKKSLSKDTRVKDVMTEYPFTIDISDTVRSALDIMEEKKIRHLPVMRKGQPYSIVTEREINFILALEKGNRTEMDLKIEEACAIQAYMIDGNTPLIEVLDHMVNHHIGSAIVLEEERLAGIFTTVDACRWLKEVLS